MPVVQEPSTNLSHGKNTPTPRLTDECTVLIPGDQEPEKLSLSHSKSDPLHKQTHHLPASDSLHLCIRRRRLFHLITRCNFHRDANLPQLLRLIPRSVSLTRMFSMRRGRRFGSKIRDSGLMLTGLWRLPSLHSFHSGFKTPQKSTPVPRDRALKRGTGWRALAHGYLMQSTWDSRTGKWRLRSKWGVGSRLKRRAGGREFPDLHVLPPVLESSERRNCLDDGVFCFPCLMPRL